MRVTYNPQGHITRVEDDDGEKVNPTPQGPSDPILDIQVTAIIRTNPWCWIPSAGGWYKVPC